MSKFKNQIVIKTKDTTELKVPSYNQNYFENEDGKVTVRGRFNSRTSSVKRNR